MAGFDGEENSVLSFFMYSDKDTLIVIGLTLEESNLIRSQVPHSGAGLLDGLNSVMSWMGHIIKITALLGWDGYDLKIAWGSVHYLRKKV